MSNEIQVLKYTFKRTEKRYEWSEDIYKGYTPYVNGEALPTSLTHHPSLAIGQCGRQMAKDPRLRRLDLRRG